MKNLREVGANPDCRDYLQKSHFVSIDPETWREAVEIQGHSKDVFQTAYQIMEHVYLNFEYCASTTSVDTDTLEVLKTEGAYARTSLMLLLHCAGVWVFQLAMSVGIFTTQRGIDPCVGLRLRTRGWKFLLMGMAGLDWILQTIVWCAKTMSLLVLEEITGMLLRLRVLTSDVFPRVWISVLA